MGKKVNGQFKHGFLYQDQLNPVAELNENGDVEALFIYGAKANVPSYIIKNGTKYRIVSDHLGSVRMVVNVSNGNVVQRIKYVAFGQVIKNTHPGFQPFGFAGGLYDHQTGLVRFGARDYDSTVGRWTTKDPILFGGTDSNLYGYTLNNPINFVDHLGMDVLLARRDVDNLPGNFQHNVILVVPETPSAVPGGVNVRCNEESGRYFFTLSGQPTPSMTFLRGEINEEPDLEGFNDFVEVNIEDGVSEEEFIEMMVDQVQNYENDYEYQLFPREGFPETNSNGFVCSVIESSHGDCPVMPNSPGQENHFNLNASGQTPPQSKLPFTMLD